MSTFRSRTYTRSMWWRIESSIFVRCLQSLNVSVPQCLNTSMDVPRGFADENPFTPEESFAPSASRLPPPLVQPQDSSILGEGTLLAHFVQDVHEADELVRELLE